MTKSGSDWSVGRRSFLARMGVGVGAFGAAAGVSVPAAQAQSSGGRYQATRHTQDDWFDSVPGKHRFVFDTTTPAAFGSALLYANNYFVANQDAYGLKDTDLAVVIVARHFSTPFAYNDAMWAKYGKTIGTLMEFSNPKTKEPPTTNLFNSTEVGDALPNMGTTLDTVLKRGVQLAVCQMATRFISNMLAQRTSGNADAIYTDLTSNLVGNSHLVAAGIVAVNRAQERGYSFAYVT